MGRRTPGIGATLHTKVPYNLQHESAPGHHSRLRAGGALCSKRSVSIRPGLRRYPGEVDDALEISEQFENQPPLLAVATIIRCGRFLASCRASARGDKWTLCDLVWRSSASTLSD